MLYTTFMIFLYNLLYSYVICHELFRYICSMYPVFKLYTKKGCINIKYI